MINDSRIKRIIREEITRELRLNEGFFDWFKSGEDKAEKHFTTENDLWPKLRDKMDRGWDPAKWLGEFERGLYDAKYLPREWNGNPRERKEYRIAAAKAIRDYHSEAQAKITSAKKKEAEAQKQRNKEAAEERALERERAANSKRMRDASDEWHAALSRKHDPNYQKDLEARIQLGRAQRAQAREDLYKNMVVLNRYDTPKDDL
jgi:hypothetical protein